MRPVLCPIWFTAYREHLRAVRPEDICTREDLARIPFTTADQLRADPQRWLCCGGAEVERVVTLKTSGTTASPKRIFFRREDQERTVDFFAHGMGELVFITLDRRAMPFLRYRTGDMGRLLPGPCPCGSFVRRMLPQGGRLAGKGRLWALDGVLLACPGVVDYTLKEGALTLYGVTPPDPEYARRALAEAGGPVPERVCAQALTGFAGTGMQKRSLLERSV